MKPPSKNTLKLIYAYEVGGGENYYNKYLKNFTWPGAASGPTIGIGIDTAYYSKEELADIFSYLPAKHRMLVESATGKKGKAGEEYTKTLQAAKIEMPWNIAERIFMFTTWKKFANLAESTFPQLDDLCADAYGAIVSLVFNRGSSLKGDSREEMRKIKELIPSKDYVGIADQIRKMKRLWAGKGLDGLVRRREAEAAAVESCLQQS
jgi:hypothetical protein